MRFKNPNECEGYDDHFGRCGRKAFLRKLLPGLVCSDDFVNGFGHDASIVDLGFDKNIVFKIDRAPNPVSVKNSWSDFCVWGRLAVVANVSDVLAVGGEAKAFMAFCNSSSRDESQ